MEKNNVSPKVTATILSMSLLTVMAGAAIAPALGIIKAHFIDAPAMLVQFIVSMPALLIIVTNLFFLPLSRVLRTRAIATTGLLLYVVAGAGCFFVDNIHVLLPMRAVLGISVGLIMPLSTGLLAYYFPPEEQARLMGLSAAMNQMGGVVATLLAGLLATVEWNYAFLVYLLGLIALVMVWLWLPDEQLGSANKRGVPLPAAPVAEVPPLGRWHVLADDDLLHLPHRLCRDSRQSPLGLFHGAHRGHHDGALRGGILRWNGLWRRDGPLPSEREVFRPPLSSSSAMRPASCRACSCLSLGSAFIGMACGVGVPLPEHHR